MTDWVNGRSISIPKRIRSWVLAVRVRCRIHAARSMIGMNPWSGIWWQVGWRVGRASRSRWRPARWSRWGLGLCSGESQGVRRVGVGDRHAALSLSERPGFTAACGQASATRRLPGVVGSVSGKPGWWWRWRGDRIRPSVSTCSTPCTYNLERVWSCPSANLPLLGLSVPSRPLALRA